MKHSIVVIIPTYNAKNSIIQIIEEVLSTITTAQIIVVDDNSPDKTADIIKKRFKSDKRVKIIVRNIKAGRGSAVIKGINEGMRNKDIQFFVEMDADLCHPPQYIPFMINKCAKNTVVIASKYKTGSSITNLPLKRRIISRFTNILLRLILGVPITDYTNGFRCYRRDVLEKIDFRSFYSKGFIVLSEIAYKAYKQQSSFVEIPFAFRQYQITKSNFNKGEAMEAIKTVISLKLH